MTTEQALAIVAFESLASGLQWDDELDCDIRRDPEDLIQAYIDARGSGTQIRIDMDGYYPICLSDNAIRRIVMEEFHALQTMGLR